MKKTYQDKIFVNESFLAAAVIFLALVVRILHVIFTAKLDPLAGDLTLDAAIYDQWAKFLVWGGEDVPTRLMQAPLFPWFVSVIYRIAGPGLTAVRVAHAILGTLTCALMITSTRRLFRSSTAGILAGAIMALYLPAIFYEGVLVPATLILFLNTLFVFLLVPESGYPVKPRLLLAGFVLGLSVIAKPVALLLLPFALVHLALRMNKARPRFSTGSFVGRSGLIFAGLIMAVAPLTIRNSIVSGEFIPLTTGGGINLYIGNNPKANGFYSIPAYRGQSLGGTPEVQQARMRTIAESESGEKLSASEVSSFWLREGIRHDIENPGSFFHLLWQKTLFFWNRYERASVESLTFHRRFGGILSLPLLTFGLVAPFALLGIFLSRERAGRLWLLYGGALTYFAAALAFYVLARYRLPVVVFLIPLAAAAVTGLLKLLRDRRWTELALMFATLFLIVRLVNTIVAKDTAAGEAGYHTRLGIVYAGKGERQLAREAFTEALRLDPSNKGARMGLDAMDRSR
ncbi:MAG: glycosyltransferase family 39 protein [Candidatus Krumholzibacteria bacterium]|nr:glycosyltransferase family 39 protein [Candidatus Krumholzibacteria bacterium]